MRSIFTLSGLLPVLASGAKFQDPILLKAGDKPIQVASPGYASPTLHDLDGDGHQDLLVGQFNGGKITVFPGKGDGKFGKGKPLMAGGKEVKVPGVW